MAKAKQDKEKETVSPQDILSAQLKGEKEAHLNFVEEVYYRVSTGSLVWDIETNGGLPPGLHRFTGPPESGKSSSALEVCRNFMTKLNGEGQKARGLYVKAEGRLSREMQTRSGLKFVYDPKEWVDGTIFVLESNIYEFVIRTISALITNPDNDTLFCIIIDSMDGLILQADAEKKFGENDKVAGAPLLTKKFLQKMANGMSKRGHICLMTSQFSTNIELDQYAQAENKRPKQGGGGWAAAHFANFVFKFRDPNQKDIILENPAEKPSMLNRAIGKRIKVQFGKSTNETTGLEISYPVRFGVVGKSSVWTSLEILDIMKMFGMIKTGTSWIDAPEKLAKEIKDATGIEMPAKFNGEKKILAWLEESPKVIKYLYERFKDTLIQEPTQDSENTDETKEAAL